MEEPKGKESNKCDKENDCSEVQHPFPLHLSQLHAPFERENFSRRQLSFSVSALNPLHPTPILAIPSSLRPELTMLLLSF